MKESTSDLILASHGPETVVANVTSARLCPTCTTLAIAGSLVVHAGRRCTWLSPTEAGKDGKFDTNTDQADAAIGRRVRRRGDGRGRQDGDGEGGCVFHTRRTLVGPPTSDNEKIH